MLKQKLKGLKKAINNVRKKYQKVVLYAKALIYQYTRVYLADKEEKEYLNNSSVKNKIKRLTVLSVKSELKRLKAKSKSEKKRLTTFLMADQYVQAKSIIKGLWQAQNGFSTPVCSLDMTVFRFQYPRLIKVLVIPELIFRQLRYHLRLLVLKLKKRGK